MTLYLQEELFSFDHFDIWDETGSAVYTVEREFFTWGRTLHVMDAQGRDVAQVQHIPFSIPSAFSIATAAQELELQRNFSFFSRSYSIDSLGWEITGDFTGHVYEFYRGKRQLAALEKDWPALHDRYRLEVQDPADALIALCAVLAIDCCDEQSR